MSAYGTICGTGGLDGRTGSDRFRGVHANSRAEAVGIQERLRLRIVQTGTDTARIRYIAGADAAYTRTMVCAAVSVLTYPGLSVSETRFSSAPAAFPYIPGLLAFREGPAILEAYSRLEISPDLLLLNGHGYAHPERFGLASHIGVILDLPTIGVAQRLMTGTAAMPKEARGSAEPVLDRNEVIGMAVRTVAGEKPVFVSAGHRMEPGSAVALVLSATRSHRITEPLWQADRASRECRKRLAGT
jgi:deoxyribonuclease V